jgi:hypothetical protein
VLFAAFAARDLEHVGQGRPGGRRDAQAEGVARQLGYEGRRRQLQSAVHDHDRRVHDRCGMEERQRKPGARVSRLVEKDEGLLQAVASRRFVASKSASRPPMRNTGSRRTIRSAAHKAAKV